MRIGMVGLGRMGANMARRLARGAHAPVGFDRTPDAGRVLEAEGLTVARTLDDLVARLAPPRAVWVMVPAGEATERAISDLADRLSPDDVVIDGGNTHYVDDVRRSLALRARGIHHLDVGTSGGVAGLERGYCLMIGGEEAVARRLEPVFRALAPGHGAAPRTIGREGPLLASEEGFLYCGKSGAGHFVKMVHNGIEYGLMQAYAEGLDLLRHAAEGVAPEHGYELDLAAICEVWRRGSVISSWLLDLTASALAADPELSEQSGFVSDSGEGRWTIEAAIERAVPVQVLAAALWARFRSRRRPSFADQVLSAMRKGFGGHTEPGTGVPH